MDILQKESLISHSEADALLEETRFELDSDWDDYNQLNRALRCGQKELVKRLLHNGARVNKEPAVFNMCTPLHLAVNLGDADIVKLLLHKGAAINIKNNNRETPLIMSAKMRKDVITDILLSVDGQQNCSNRENLSHMHIACMRNRVDVVKKFIQQGARINHCVSGHSILWSGYTPLHFAVQFQCLETVEFLINSGADITSADTNKLTPLHFADILRDERILDLILSVHKYEITNPVNTEGLSHFHIACTRNNPEVVESFIKQGIDINIKVLESSLNWTGYRPINFAIDYECTEVVQLLLMHNANINLCDIVRNPIQYAYKTANKKIIDSILSKSAIKKENAKRIKKNLSDLHTVCIQRNLNEMEMEIEQGNLSRGPVNLNLPIWAGCTPLHLAIKRRCASTAELLLKHGADITVKDSRGKTPLHLAFETKQMNIVDLILTAHLGVSANPTDNNGLSHFHISCMRNKLRVIKNFLLSGQVDVNSSVNQDSVFWPSYTGLHFAAEFELKRVVELLMNKGADVTAKNGIGLTPLDIAIKCTDSSKCWRDEVEQSFGIIDSILGHAARAKVANLDDRGFSRLHVASINNDTLAVEQFLYTHPESVNQRVTWDKSDWLGYTPLHFAMHFGSIEVANLLLSKGACISLKNAEGNTPLHTAFGLRYHLREVENPALLYIPENPIGDEGYSHFHVACQIGDLDAVKYFLDLGVDVNMPTKFTGVYEYTGQTALHLSVSNDTVNEEVLWLLLSRGADVNSRDAEYNTPLHCTKHNVSTRPAEILLAHGAEINARNLYEETPLYLTCYDSEFSDPQVTPAKIQCLLDNGADIDLENDDGERPLTVIDSWPEHILDKPSCMAVILRHIKKLQLIGRRFSIRNSQDYYRLLSKCHANGSYRELDFAKQCREELLEMAGISVDSYTTLKDVLNKRLNDMALHSRNNDFRGIIEAPDFDRCFPIYGFLIKLQFKRGLERRPLLEEAKASFSLAYPLPDACLERIFESLSNEDLRNVIAGL
ncbi:ankyrin-3 [Nasonia vitripennis]|uniref:Uncharacterized protein n=1 Tax=Nasonia vitripennis TaxID=7425 RepID=A0A7M7HFA0_NASVI|nr:ankyrin-3 [Nasonia vitripennis]XP_008213010.1 ankyrin-3 [Nasonia vitripennis]